jgi:hypothetical protein
VGSAVSKGVSAIGQGAKAVGNLASQGAKAVGQGAKAVGQAAQAGGMGGEVDPAAQAQQVAAAKKEMQDQIKLGISEIYSPPLSL